MGPPNATLTADTPSLRKERGAFFTPPEISRFLVRWAVRAGTDVVLEPSCGEAVFLEAAGQRIRELSGETSGVGARQLRGIDLHAPSLTSAAAVLSARGLTADLRSGDFFDCDPEAIHDAIVGNPPYVRYQQFTGDSRAKALRAAFSQGVRLTGLASSWAAFVVHATRFLKPDGRLGLVLPAELLTVSYAAPLRRFLLERFAKVRLVVFDELVFPGVLEEVVLLLAEGSGAAPCFELFQARDLAELSEIEAVRGWVGFTPESGAKWTPALLPSTAFAAYQGIVAGEGFASLVEWGAPFLGSVTGNNDYFAMTEGAVREWKLPARELLRVSPPGSRHLNGLNFGSAAWKELVRQGAAGFLFHPDPANPSAAARRYIAEGERRGVHRAYKCRVRDPWWSVPLVRRPDVLLTYMDHDRPRLTSNEARVYHLNSLYGICLKPARRVLGRDLLPLSCLNSVTLLGAEIVGRAYGGGLLKLEPREADNLPVPSAGAIESVATELRALRPQLATALRGRKVLDAVDLVDRVLLRRALKVGDEAIRALRGAREVLFSRRELRGKGSPRGAD